MCVTNTTSRRPVTLSGQASSTSSILSQRLCSSLFGLQRVVSASTGSTMPARSEAKTVAPAPLLASAPVPSSSDSTDDESKNRKRRAKRKRKPQKPGKTAKMNDRHFVVHNYHDHAKDREDQDTEEQGQKPKRRRGGVSVAFPFKLHAMLNQIEVDGLAHVISWQPHGRCFVIHDPKTFVGTVMPKYFRQSKLTSFQRQLNLYGFQRLTRGPDNGGYYHEFFLRGKPFLCKHMTRIKVKGTGFKAASSPDDEPDFYRMPPVTVTPHHSCDDASGEEEEEEESVHSESTDDEHHPDEDLEPLPLYDGPAQYEQPTFPVNQDSPMKEALPMVEPVSLASISDPSVEPATYMEVASPQQPPTVSSSPSSDDVLDEVVDELFLQQPSEENDTILDFVETWNPGNFDGNTWYGSVIEDDAHLGRLLEKVLED